MSGGSWRREAFLDGPLMCATKNFENWHDKRATRELREKCWQKLLLIVDGLKRNPDGNPRVGKSRKLSGIQSPIHYIKLTGDLRLLYYVKHGGKEDRKELWVLDVSDHDYLSSKAKAAEHLVHGNGLDNLLKIIWDDSKVVGEEFSWDDEYKTKAERDEAYERWRKEPGLYNKDRDLHGSDEEVFRAFDSATILQQYIVGAHITKNELEEKWLEEGKLDPDIRLKDEQKEFLIDPSPIFILEGVAGTGKTTVLERRFANYCERNNGWRERALFLTHNESLTRAVISHLKKIFPPEEHGNLENVVVDVETWVRRLHRGIPDESKRTFKRDRKITYDTFTGLQKKWGKSGSESGVMWEEYRGVIQGACIGPEDGLTNQEYLDLSRDRGLWEKDEAQRNRVYNDIRKFVSKLEKEDSRYSRKNGGWTDQDLAREVRKGRAREGSEEFLDAVFIDEVQDLTELQILLILDCIDKKGEKRFEAAGDVSQSVYPSAFRFDDLRKRVHQNLEPKDFPKPHLMTTNYRATPYLVEAANFVLERHKKVKQEQIDTLRMSKAASSSSGSHPGIIRVESLDDLLDSLRQKDLPNPWCPLIVRDESLIEGLKERLENANILSIPGSKGLEFENVVLFDPFSGTDRLIDDYFHHKKGKADFKAEGVCLELRHLFVGITRARYRLAIVSTGEYSEPPQMCSGMDWLESSSERFSREGSKFLDEFSKKDATPSDYVERGLEFESRGAFELAAAAFGDADKMEEASRCKARMHLERGELGEASWEFEEAARYASDSGSPDIETIRGYRQDAMRAVDDAIEVSEGTPDVELFQSKSRLAEQLGNQKAAAEATALYHERMADHPNEEIRKTHLRKAAEAYYNLDDRGKAIELLKEVPDNRRIAEISLEAGNATEFFLAIENALEKMEDHHEALSAIFERGNHDWRKPIAALMRVHRDELSGLSPKRDPKKALFYSKGEKKKELTLESARRTGDWSLEARTLEEMGRSIEAAEIYRDNGEEITAVMRLMELGTEEANDAIADIVKTLDGRESRRLSKILNKRRDFQDILIRNYGVWFPHELVKKTKINYESDALGFLRALSCPREKGNHPVEGVLDRVFNNDFIDFLRDFLLWGIGTKQGRLSDSAFKYSLNYLIYIHQHKDGRRWNSDARHLLRDIWYLQRYCSEKKKNLKSIVFNDAFLYSIVRDAASSGGADEGLRVWANFYRISRNEDVKANPMMMKKSFDLTKGILMYRMSEYLFDDVTEGMNEFSKYNYDIYEFSHENRKWVKRLDKSLGDFDTGLLSSRHWDILMERGLKIETVREVFTILENGAFDSPESISSEILEWAEPVDEILRIKGGWLDSIELDGYREKQRELDEARAAEEPEAEEPEAEEPEAEEPVQEQEPAATSSLGDLWGDDQEEEGGFVPGLPLERASESDDPYDVFSEVSGRFLKESGKSETAAFLDLWPEWEREIETLWEVSNRGVKEEIALIAAQQHVIDTNKRILPEVPVTNQYSSLILTRASKHLDRLPKYTWGQRCFTN